MGRYRISQLANRVAVPATTLRYDEAQGLPPTQRHPNGYRTYGDHDVERVQFISTAKSVGLPPPGTSSAPYPHATPRATRLAPSPPETYQP